MQFLRTSWPCWTNRDPLFPCIRLHLVNHYLPKTYLAHPEPDFQCPSRGQFPLALLVFLVLLLAGWTISPCIPVCLVFCWTGRTDWARNS
ncbi:hypothetical protein CW304_11680, partial [Bacillus sp. UFRGS-B20]